MSRIVFFISDIKAFSNKKIWFHFELNSQNEYYYFMVFYTQLYKSKYNFFATLQLLCILCDMSIMIPISSSASQDLFPSWFVVVNLSWYSVWSTLVTCSFNLFGKLYIYVCVLLCPFSVSLYTLLTPWRTFSITCMLLSYPVWIPTIRYRKAMLDSCGSLHFNSFVFPCFMRTFSVYSSTNEQSC